MNRINAGVLDVAFQQTGPVDGPAVILLHGFPYDIRAYDEVAAKLAGEGCRVIVPFLRGFGPTCFLSAATPRSGEQAVLGADLLALMDALDVRQAVLGGYDWGGRAACVVAALWPDRVAGLISCGGYNIQDIATAADPKPPEAEHRLWYQYYFHAERGRAGLAGDRRALCRLLWRLWSPSWAFDDATFEQTAAAFDNPDFVNVVIHSYRHRFGLVPGDPAVAWVQAGLASQPPIPVPSVVLHGADDGVSPPDSSEGHAKHFTGRYQRRVVPEAGHNLPQEEPAAFAQAVQDLLGR